MNYKIFVITIDRAVNRYKIVKEHMIKNKIKFSKFNGIDGNILTRNDIKGITTNFCRDLCTKSIVGCALSHILLWKHISELEEDYFIILEDDSLFDIEKFNELRPYIEKNIDRFFMIYLDGVGINLKKREKLKDDSLSVKDEYYLDYYEYCLSHSCYIITKKVAKTLYNFYKKYKIGYHIDYTDNQILNQSDGIVILKPGISNNTGNDCSTMMNKKKSLSWIPSDLYYSLTFPIIRLNYIVINIITIIIGLLIFLLMLANIKSYYIWIPLVLLSYDVLTFTD